MSRKLTAVNLLLALLLIVVCWQLYANWRQARIREEAFWRRTVRPVDALPVEQPEPVGPIQAANYLEIALKMLFSKDRNPTVVVEEAPPKPVPSFPQAFGVISLGGETWALMSEKQGAPQKNYRAGEPVGEFKIASLTTNEIVLEWEGKSFAKTLEELRPKEAVQAASSGQAQPAGAEAEAPFAPPPPQPQAESIQEKIKEELKPKDGGPGLDVGGTIRACVPGDSTPAGAVQGGYRKVVAQTPFGPTCRWEPAR